MPNNDCPSPFVSVIVPVFNGQDTIGQCVEAIIGQEYKKDLFEVIIVDNKSTDKTIDIVKQYPVILTFAHDKTNSYVARNRGIRIAQGELILFTDADCMPSKNWIADIVKAFNSDNVIAAGGPIVDLPSRSHLDRFLAEELPIQNYQKLTEEHYPSLVGGNSAYKRSILEGLEGFDERMYTGGDVELSWRAQKASGGDIKFIESAIVYHDHRTTLSGLYKRYRRYGYSSAMMTAINKGDGQYPQDVSWQWQKVSSQLGALLRSVLSIIKRNTIGYITDIDEYQRKLPVYWFLAEFGALSGRLMCIVETRNFQRPPRGF